MRLIVGILICGVLVIAACSNGIYKKPRISGELKQWHRVTLTFRGPATSEQDTENPFLDYRLNVTFKSGDKEYIVPGFYAANGKAGETGAVSGNKWRVYFCPDKKGTWTYVVSFRHGKAIAVNDDPGTGDPVFFDGAKGSFQIVATDKTGMDFRAKGKLRYVGGRYPQFAGTGDFFLKGGADSPENFLAYDGFDGTYSNKDLQRRSGEAFTAGQLHRYEPHAADWKEGDPTWTCNRDEAETESGVSKKAVTKGDNKKKESQGENNTKVRAVNQDKRGECMRGKNIIGALNYLASKGMNSVYMLTMNVMGDGDDVWPWTDRNERYRFDCSKLDQWEIVFSHMDRLGIMLHLVTQETENQCLLDMGYMDVQRKLYYRELVARFAHHLAITWNMGEENGPADFSPIGQTDMQRKDAAAYLKKINPYNDQIVIHTHSNEQDRNKIIGPLLGDRGFDGLSIQAGNMYESHYLTFKWLSQSSQSGKQWNVCIDEIGPANTGVKPDSIDPDHDGVRRYVLWGNLMAGGGGVEWYFGYDYPDNDLSCEDWHSRAAMWDQTRYALEFFQQHLPFWEMKSRDDITSNKSDYCLAMDGEIYAIYIPGSGQNIPGNNQSIQGSSQNNPEKVQNKIDLTGYEGEFDINWFNPRKGRELELGTVTRIPGGLVSDIGSPPSDLEKDWVALIGIVGI